MWTDGYADAKSDSSHHLPKPRQGAIAIDVKIERIGMPHTTVRQQAEQVMPRYSHCNNVEIEHIGMSHTTVSQQAEQVRIVTGQQAMQKDDRSQRKIVCRWRECQTNLLIESPINPNTISEIEVTLPPSDNGNRQSIGWRRPQRSNKFSKEGDSRVDKIYQHVKRPPGGSQPRHAPTMLQSIPTHKSKVPREASLPSCQRLYWSHISRLQPWSRPDGHRSWHPRMIASWNNIHESMPSADHYQPQNSLYRACRCYAQSSDSASALQLGMNNHFRGTYVLGVYECDYTQLRYTIDGYERCRQRKLPSMPSYERTLSHPDQFAPRHTPRYTSYEGGTGWQVVGWLRQWR